VYSSTYTNAKTGTKKAKPKRIDVDTLSNATAKTCNVDNKF